MLDKGMIDLILWVPFALIVLIAGIIFCINGYRKGLWRALLSLTATAVSAVISVLVTPLIAKPMSRSLAPMIAEMNLLGTENPDPALTEMVNELALGVAQSVVALVLFGAVFFILTIILKVVCAKVKKDALLTEQKGLRFAGLGVRLLDTVLYALILLMPLYGTLSAYVPAAAEVMNSSFIEDEESKELAASMDYLSGHLLVQAEGVVPLSTAYNSLSEFIYGETDTKVNLPEMMDTVETVVEHYNAADGSLSTMLESDLDAEIGSLLNDQELMVMVKEYLIDMGMKMIISESDDQQLKQGIDTLFADFSYEPITDKNEQAREGRAIMLMAFSSDSETAMLGNVLEGLATHPMIGAQKVGAFLKESGMLPEAYEGIVDKLINKLAECTADGYDGPRFAEYYSAIEGLLTMISNSNITELVKNGETKLYFLDVHPDALRFATELFNDFLEGMTEDMGFEAGNQPIVSVLEALPEEIEKLEGNENFVAEKEYESIATMMEIAQIATGGGEELDELIDSYSSSNRIEVNGEVIEDPLAWYTESELIPSLLENMMEENGSDPMGIGASLTEEQKQIFSAHLDDYLKEVYPEGNEDLQKDLEMLKAFLGMN